MLTSSPGPEVRPPGPPSPSSHQLKTDGELPPRPPSGRGVWGGSGGFPRGYPRDPQKPDFWGFRTLLSILRNFDRPPPHLEAVDPTFWSKNGTVFEKIPPPPGVGVIFGLFDQDPKKGPGGPPEDPPRRGSGGGSGSRIPRHGSFRSRSEV